MIQEAKEAKDAKDGSNGCALYAGKFVGPNEFHQLVRAALETAAQHGWKEIIISDATFDDWPLGERGVVESLVAWAKTGRTLTILAGSYRDLVLRHPRFVVWRRTWDHVVSCRKCPAADSMPLPSAIWSPQWALQRVDPAHNSTGWCGPEAQRRVRLREKLDEWLRQSSPGFPATTLGL